jgi:pimeloyl-ACP methyl ester carboxylesterase
VPPFPYEQAEVVLPAAGGTPLLAGTLTRPRGDPPAAAVLLLQGGSPLDRDGTLMGHRPLLVIADALTRAGFATLRLDDRGVGGSGGDKLAATLDDLAADAERGVRFFRRQEGVPADRVGLLGHSGGALLAASVASRDRGVAFVVLLGCPARPLPFLMAAQAAAAGDGTETVNERLAAAAAEVLRASAGAPDAGSLVEARWRELVADMPAPARADAERFTGSMARKLRAFVGSTCLRDMLCFDPEPVLRRVACPVLAMWGELDQGGKLPNASAWEMARILGQGACADFAVLQVPRVNHLLQTCVTGRMDEGPSSKRPSRRPSCACCALGSGSDAADPASARGSGHARGASALRSRVTASAASSAATSSMAATRKWAPGTGTLRAPSIPQRNAVVNSPGPSRAAMPRRLLCAPWSWPCSVGPTRRLISDCTEGPVNPQSAMMGTPTSASAPVGARP